MGLWLPPSAVEDSRVLVCTVPGCDKRFPTTQRQQFERHVSACAKRNFDRIQEMTHDNFSDPFTSVGDTEQFGWVRKLASEVGPTEANKRLRHGSRRQKKEAPN